MQLEGYSLFPIVWEAVDRLEWCGLNVIAFSCDGASPNRAFYKMHGTSGLVHKTANLFCEDRDIYFICDVPHLMKTTRNCWSNSFANKHSRALWVSYIENANSVNPGPNHNTAVLFAEEWQAHQLDSHCEQNRTASGLSLVPKLRKDHVYLTSYSRMRVNLATQVGVQSII